MPDDLGEFHGEAREILDGIAADLVTLEKKPGDADLVNRIFRGAHSLKGLAGMLGFPAVSQMAHKLESALDGVRMGRVKADAATLDVLLAANELLVRMVDGVRDGDPDRERAAAAAMAERLATLASSTGPSGPKRRIDPELAKVLSEYEEHRLDEALAKGKRPWRIDVSFPFESFDRDLPALKERLKHYGEVITTMAGDLSAADRMGFGLLVVSAKDPSVLLVAVAIPDAKVSPVAVIEDEAAKEPPAGAVRTGAFEGFSATPTSWGVAELPSSPASAVSSKITELDWNALSKEGDLETPPLFAPAPAAPAPPPERKETRPEGAATLRVNIERIEGLMTLVGELVTAKNAIGRVAERLQSEKGPRAATLEVFKVKRTLERRLDELQKGILQVRMLPLGDLFTKLTRVVRNLSREGGKEVDLVIEGAETELDKVMIDELSDPLIHIVRNAVDHGIESPADRAAAGKPARGTLAIRAYPKGNHVAIEVSDDGSGLDTDRIKTKAIEKGMLAPGADPSREELFDLIFAPGFSTKETVSEVSGRGVGMDVVRNNIMKLSGMIDTKSERGKGTTFTITLPLTLATMKALVVETAGQTYAVPLASVLECVSVRQEEVKIEGDREAIALRDLTVPIVRVARFFGLDEMPLPEEERARSRLQVVVVGVAQYRVGLAVERLGGQQDVVVKPLGAPLTRLKGIMGATNLGNDRPVLVLDVAGLVGSAVAGRLQEAS
jgi:two-component system chemotaxis sensor kinase CheA